jgi:hypothetical protein
MSKKLHEIIWIKNSSGMSAYSNPQNVNNVKDLLNSTGPGFCLAKFTQGTLHLGTGMTHACHHPSPHEIPLNEIRSNPGALFNTNKLKIARREMLEGKRPSECDYCWRIEDNGNNSDRFFKSLEPWAIEDHDNISTSDPDKDIYPTYLEVDFSNVCNFSCIYCGPEFSSKWVDVLKQHGPIKLLENTKHVRWAQGWQDLDNIAYKNREENPYVTAFWKWFPEAYKHLKVYRITGGEPLLSKETFNSMDWLIQNPNTELEFSINSNLGVPDKLWNQFIEKLKVLVNGNYIKRFTMFTSVDAWGQRAEYIRPGLNFETFKNRYEQLLEIGNVRMCAFNILSITSIHKLLEWQYELKQKYNCAPNMLSVEEETGFKIGQYNSHINRHKKNTTHYSVVGIDIAYIRHPEFLDILISSEDLVQEYLIPAMNYISSHTFTQDWAQHQGFENYEIGKLKRIVLDRLYRDVNKPSDNNDKLHVNMAMFYDFVNDHDHRYKTKFVEVFPEMEDFYNLCKVENIKIKNEK